jgi:hypothetical protein
MNKLQKSKIFERSGKDRIFFQKNGMYFTIMTVAFLFIFIFAFILPTYRQYAKRMSVIEMRLDSMNDYIKSLERDAERGLYISSYRAILSLEEYITVNGTFLNDVDATFKEALLNGTVKGRNTSLMAGSTFPLWIDKMKEEAGKLNIDTIIQLNDVRIYQEDPWNVMVRANLSMSIKDITDIASWNRQEFIDTKISIIDFEDPIYIVYSLGRTTNIINATPFDGNYTFKTTKWNVSNLLSHVQRRLYAANPDAPSFLMRLQNDLGPSPYGIESLVDLVRLDSQGLEIYDTSSIVDYYYWDESTNGNYRINFTPSWFKLDAGHLAKYNVSQLNCQIGSPGCTI